VLFNEPKLLKLEWKIDWITLTVSFSALQRAEIAEIAYEALHSVLTPRFQCSSTSRNC